MLWSGVVLLRKLWSYLNKRQCRTQEWLSRIIWFHLSHLRLNLVFWESAISHLFTWHFISGLSNIFNYSNIMLIMLKYLIYLLLFCICRWCYLNKCKNNIYDVWTMKQHEAHYKFALKLCGVDLWKRCVLNLVLMLVLPV